MATNILNFFSRATDAQFSRDFLFRVQDLQIKGAKLVGDQELLYARTANLPGRAIENKIANYSGQQFNVPGKSTYTNSEAFSIEFYMDATGDIRQKLEAASRTVFDDQTTTGQYEMPGDGDVITLVMLDKQLKPVKTITLYGASIRDIGEVGYQIADGTGEIVNMTCTFSYHWYKSDMYVSGA